MSVERFKTAQRAADDGFETALAELRAGRKTSHWIWYIFPQLAALGRSSTAKFYGLKDLAEAYDYLRDPQLRENLLLVSEVVTQQLEQGIRVVTLMGGTTDALKLASCLTLFEAAARNLNRSESSPALTALEKRSGEILTLSGQQGFARCQATLQQIESAPPA